MGEINAVNPAPEEAAGSLLRQARESQRMSIEHLASVVKVPVGKLQALESEDWSTLSDPNLARALAATVCRALKVDSSPIMSRMPAAVAISLGGGREPLNQPFKGVQPHRLDLRALASHVVSVASFVFYFCGASGSAHGGGRHLFDA